MPDLLEKVLIGLFSAITGGFIGHRLTLTKDNGNRRREFCGLIRALAARIDAAHFINLFKTYQESVPEVRDACAKIADDIAWFRRKQFAAIRSQYCSFKQSDIVPPPPSAAATPEEMAARKKKHEAAKAMLTETLEKMMACAR